MNEPFENYTLRDARADDLPAIVEIYNAAIPGRMATADTLPVTIESRLVWFDQHNPQTRPLWVLEGKLEQKTESVAWISLNSFYGRPAYQATAEVSLYVAPSHHGQGIGTRLLQKMIEKCPDFGVETLVGFVFAHNTASIKMNEKVGFQQWGFLPEVAQLDGQKRDLMIVGLKIGANSK